MLIDKKINIKISNRTLSYYKKWFDDIKINDVINIEVNKIIKNSAIKISVKCDVCNKESVITIQKYNKNINKYNIYTCKRCFNIKNKKTKLKKYNNENFNNRANAKKTCLERYGVDNPSKCEKFKELKKKTTFKNYNVYNPSQSIIIRKKYKNTIENKLLNKYENLISVKKNNYIFLCKKGHEFEISRELLKNRNKLNTEICTVCNPISSSNSGHEIQLQDFIKENYKNDIILNSRSVITPLELDIYLPELKIAFEFNGVYWHNELYKENNYHLNKTELCENHEIQLIHIWEDDWLYKQEIVKSMILNKLGKTPNKIFGRKTVVKEVIDNKLIREFINKNHLQGFVGSKIKLGLFLDNELVSLMTFGKRRVSMGKKTTNDDEYELLRFCNKLNTNVVGGASKLFKYFIRNYKPKEITTYADRSHSNGNLYEQLGFEYIGKTQPNYYYIIDGIRKHRFNFRKDVLIKEGFDSNKTEHQIMIDRNIFRIYDSGNLKFKK